MEKLGQATRGEVALGCGKLGQGRGARFATTNSEYQRHPPTRWVVESGGEAASRGNQGGDTNYGAGNTKTLGKTITNDEGGGAPQADAEVAEVN